MGKFGVMLLDAGGGGGLSTRQSQSQLLVAFFASRPSQALSAKLRTKFAQNTVAATSEENHNAEIARSFQSLSEFCFKRSLATSVTKEILAATASFAVTPFC